LGWIVGENGDDPSFGAKMLGGLDWGKRDGTKREGGGVPDSRMYGAIHKGETSADRRKSMKSATLHIDLQARSH